MNVPPVSGLKPGLEPGSEPGFEQKFEQGLEPAPELSPEVLPGKPAPAEPPPAALADPDFQRLLATFHEARPKDDLAGIEKAWLFAASHHAGQKRASGEAYLSH